MRSQSFLQLPGYDGAFVHVLSHILGQQNGFIANGRYCAAQGFGIEMPPLQVRYFGLGVSEDDIDASFVGRLIAFEVNDSFY
jgi:hypothetical protein